MHKENISEKSFQRSKAMALLFSLIAAIAIAIAIYAFQQKRQAHEQANLAKEKNAEALQQQKIALEQRIVADSNKEHALEQREIALESERRALSQKEIADAASRKAEESRLEALQQQFLANEQKLNAEKQQLIAERNALEAKKQQAIAIEQTAIAKEEKITAVKLKELAGSRSLANEAFILLNENLVDSSKYKTFQAYRANKINGGPRLSNDIYNALNNNWTRSIDNKNVSFFHKQPVRSITSNNSFIYTADESGILYMCIIKNSSLQKIKSYDVGEEVRALAVSPTGNKLIALTVSGNGIVFNVTSSSITVSTNFNFPGTGKAVTFTSNDHFVLLTSKGIGKYHMDSLASSYFHNDDRINAFATGKSGRFYLACNNLIKIYRCWENILEDSFSVALKLNSKVSSLAVDNTEQYFAAGTYEGFVCIINLRNNNIMWNKAIHLSNVNDLKFQYLDDDFLQLASAGADKTIKLIDVEEIRRENNQEVITLNGHTKWVYGVDYTPDGKWLVSTGEDNKVIVWKPSMDDLYKILHN